MLFVLSCCLEKPNTKHKKRVDVAYSKYIQLKVVEEDSFGSSVDTANQKYKKKRLGVLILLFGFVNLQIVRRAQPYLFR